MTAVKVVVGLVVVATASVLVSLAAASVVAAARGHRSDDESQVIEVTDWSGTRRFRVIEDLGR